MTITYVKISADVPPGIRKRLSMAALHRNIPGPIYARALILEWLALGAPRSGLPPVGEGRVPRAACRPLRIPVTRQQHRELRIMAATLDCGVGPLVVQILNARCPLDVEIAAELLGG